MILTPAERLLQKLGVTEPDEIDLEAIAYHVGACIRFRPLDGCEARIIGRGDRAIITVNQASSPRRQKFSIAHELGHWQHHMGRPLICRAEELQSHRHDPTAPERVADAYASDLLMPNYLFRPLLRNYPKLSFKTVQSVADIFGASRPAAAIRLVEADHSPAILVCHGPQGRKWFVRAPSVPSRWFPQDALHADSFAFSVLHAGSPDDATPRKIGADAWFDRWEAERSEVHEQTIRTAGDEVLTLVLISDQHMLDETDNRSSARSR